MSDLHSELHEHAEAVEPSVEHALPTAQVAPKRRGPGRPPKRGPGRPPYPTFKRLHISFDEASYRSLLVVSQVLKAFGRQGSMSQALRFAVDLSARTLAPDTTLLRSTDMTAEIARLMREAAEATR